MGISLPAPFAWDPRRRADFFTGDQQVTLDFAGRRVIAEENEVGRTMYDHRDAVVQEVQYAPSSQGGASSDQGPSSVDPASIINPGIVQPAPKVGNNLRHVWLNRRTADFD